ncbi:hypothetical protein OVY01_18465 [Robbsia sp. Bb-Pol-6]|uniref:Uncharacterized protein n=1 Tax=Robbsia betulipollinis TaxID=2981849 RepID=A0ABT3ZTD8_9BURK|nr:hypothetical protein [Robbsia betulipollinis]MCY0389133.1 hypothetical protein [Robbsia betulipollinis]
MGKPSTNELLRRSVDLADLAAEGFDRIEKLLSVVKHLAFSAELKHIGTLAAETQLIADNYLNQVDSTRGDLDAIRTEVSHG